MNSDSLYLAALKMLNDKYQITDYPKDKFINIYNQTYKENDKNPLNPTNDINKIILFKIKDDIENEIKIKNETPQEKEIIIDDKLKEIESIRASMNLLSSSTLNANANVNVNPNDINGSINGINGITNDSNDSIDGIIDKTKTIPNIQINNQSPTINNNFKTFIINTNKNNFKIIPNIDIKNNLIYPCCISVPNDIKKITPYILLSISDGVKTINYTYICHFINNGSWDIWKPITDNYSEINLNNNNWNISFIDFRANHIDLSHYYHSIIDVLEDSSNKTFSLNIDDGNGNGNITINYDIYDKIKIIKEDGMVYESSVVGFNGDNKNRIIIKKNKLNMNDFVNSTIYNYKNQISLLFKYHSK